MGRCAAWAWFEAGIPYKCRVNNTHQENSSCELVLLLPEARLGEAGQRPFQLVDEPDVGYASAPAAQHQVACLTELLCLGWAIAPASLHELPGLVGRTAKLTRPGAPREGTRLGTPTCSYVGPQLVVAHRPVGLQAGEGGQGRECPLSSLLAQLLARVQLQT